MNNSVDKNDKTTIPIKITITITSMVRTGASVLLLYSAIV